MADDHKALVERLREPSCEKCNDTGRIALWSRDGRYARPGPVPEDARGVFEGACWECVAEASVHG